MAQAHDLRLGARRTERLEDAHELVACRARPSDTKLLELGRRHAAEAGARRALSLDKHAHGLHGIDDALATQRMQRVDQPRHRQDLVAVHTFSSFIPLRQLGRGAYALEQRRGALLVRRLALQGHGLCRHRLVSQPPLRWP